MLAGIVKPKGEIIDLNEMNDVLRASARRCFEAGFLYGVNENSGMIRYNPQIKAEIFVTLPPHPDAAPSASAEPEHLARPGAAPSKPIEDFDDESEPERPAEPGQPAKNADRTGAK